MLRNGFSTCTSSSSLFLFNQLHKIIMRNGIALINDVLRSKFSWVHQSLISLIKKGRNHDGEISEIYFFINYVLHTHSFLFRFTTRCRHWIDSIQFVYVRSVLGGVHKGRKLFRGMTCKIDNQYVFFKFCPCIFADCGKGDWLL